MRRMGWMAVVVGAGVAISLAIFSALVSSPGLASAAEAEAPEGALPEEAWLKRSITDTPDPVVAGEKLTYTASATNLGPAVASNVTMWVGLPDESDFVSSSFSPGQGACEPFDGQSAGTTCWVEALAVGESATLEVVVRPRHPGREFLLFDAWAENGPGLTFEISEATMVLDPRGCTIYGTQGSDSFGNEIYGTSGPDVICALGSNDHVYGRGAMTRSWVGKAATPSTEERVTTESTAGGETTSGPWWGDVATTRSSVDVARMTCAQKTECAATTRHVVVQDTM